MSDSKTDPEAIDEILDTSSTGSGTLEPEARYRNQLETANWEEFSKLPDVLERGLVLRVCLAQYANVRGAAVVREQVRGSLAPEVRYTSSFGYVYIPSVYTNILDLAIPFETGESSQVSEYYSGSPQLGLPGMRDDARRIMNTGLKMGPEGLCVTCAEYSKRHRETYGII